MDAAAVLHVLAAAAWVGGTIALVFATVPTLRKLPREHRAASVKMLGHRWKPIGWGSLAILAATGSALAFGYYNAADPDVLLDTRFGNFVLAKSVLFVLLVITAFLHDFVLGPRLNRQIRDGKPLTLRRPMVIIGWSTFALTITLPILGVLMTR